MPRLKAEQLKITALLQEAPFYSKERGKITAVLHLEKVRNKENHVIAIPTGATI
jgi:hypothetical protein